MANSDKDILITPGKDTANLPEISFIGLDNAPIKLRVLDDNTLSWEGSAGQLFSINNNLTSGSIFSVNDVSGIPSIDVNANGAVSLAPYNGNVAVGHTDPDTKLHVKGNVAGDDIARFEDGTVQIDDTLNQNNWQLQVTNSNNAFNQSLIRAEYTGANAAANVKLFSGTYGSTENVSITADGSLTLAGSFEPDTINFVKTLANGVSTPALQVNGNTFLSFNSLQGSLFIGLDDAIALVAGDSRPQLEANITLDSGNENIYLATDDDLVIITTPDNWDSEWEGRNQSEFKADGNLYLNTTNQSGVGKLYTNGDPMWIDDYGIFKSNRNTIEQTLTIPANTNCMSAGPLTINNGETITIADGASWSIV